MKTRRLLSAVFVVTMLMLTTGSALADKPIEVDSNGVETKWKDSGCTKIQSGVLTYSEGHYLEGEPLTTGFDPYGYNYQAHMFKGSYANAYLGGYGFPPYQGDDDVYLAENPGADDTWFWPYRNTELLMKWSDTWLSNVDCNGDEKLDRGYGCDPVDADSSACEGAWVTNHMWGSYTEWNLVGDWELVFVRDDGVKFPHTWTVTSQTDGQFQGSGGSSDHTYTFEGTIDGGDLDFVAEYGETLPGYTYDAGGKVLSDGSLSGDWKGSNERYGTWYSSAGSASATACDWDYFTKIVAVPSDATQVDGVWYAADGTEIGPAIWGGFATIQTVENDPCAGIQGVQYLSPDHAGLGGW